MRKASSLQGASVRRIETLRCRARGTCAGRVLLTLLVAAIWLLWRPLVVSAAVTYCDTANYKIEVLDRFVEPTSNNDTGSRAIISTRNADLCNPVENGDVYSISSAWVMIYDISEKATGFDAYAQVGFIICRSAPNVTCDGGSPTYTPRFFSEYDKGPSNPFVRKVGAIANSGGTQYWYTAWRDPADGFIHLKYCSGGFSGSCFELDKTPFDPLNVWGRDIGSKFAGETHYFESDIPGYIPDHKTVFSSVQEKISGTWQSAGTAQEGPHCSAYHLNYTSASQFSVYTDPVQRSVACP